jgi:hypothetical protein
MAEKSKKINNIPTIKELDEIMAIEALKRELGDSLDRLVEFKKREKQHNIESFKERVMKEAEDLSFYKEIYSFEPEDTRIIKVITMEDLQKIMEGDSN